MPIYEYECTSCHHHVDLLQKINEPPVTLCPNCSEDTLIKLISAAGFQLKGTGWYETDFKNKGTQPKAHDVKKSASTSTDSSSKESKSTSTKGDA